MAFERVVARTPPTAEESVVVKVVEPQKRETTKVDETIKRTEHERFFLNTYKNALRMIPYQNTHAFSTQKKGKKGVLTILRETKKKERKYLNPSLGFIYKKREGSVFFETQ